MEELHLQKSDVQRRGSRAAAENGQREGDGGRTAHRSPGSPADQGKDLRGQWSHRRQAEQDGENERERDSPGQYDGTIVKILEMCGLNDMLMALTGDMDPKAAEPVGRKNSKHPSLCSARPSLSSL